MQHMSFKKIISKESNIKQDMVNHVSNRQNTCKYMGTHVLKRCIHDKYMHSHE